MNLLTDNLILHSDSYKVGHWMLRRHDFSHLFNYAGTRGGKFDEIVVANILPVLTKYLSKRITHEDIDKAEWFINAHLGPGIFNRKDWERVVDVHNGYIPISIKAIPEGTVVPAKTAMLTTVNTDPELDWISSYFEPLILQHMWYGASVASMGRAAKKIIVKYLKKTTDLTGPELEFQASIMLHDFGYRGASSTETAINGDMAHLINFIGTDTMLGLAAAIEYYGAAPNDAISVIASEHTVMCMNADAENRDDYPSAEKMVEVLERRCKDTGEFQIVSVVSDTYDVYRFAGEFIGERLHDRIAATGGKLVVRPDSGDPIQVPLDVIELLGSKTGWGVNSKGYKELPPYLGVLQGDGINLDTLELILEEAERRGIAANNLVFGMGGGLLQEPNRDDTKFAMKGSAACLNDEWLDIFKDPITDPGKASLKGRVTTVKQSDGSIVTKRLEDVADTDVDMMETVWENGKLLYHPTFQEIRARASEGIF